jgi:hypothetical protein
MINHMSNDDFNSNIIFSKIQVVLLKLLQNEGPISSDFMANVRVASGRPR